MAWVFISVRRRQKGERGGEREEEKKNMIPLEIYRKILLSR